MNSAHARSLHVLQVEHTEYLFSGKKWTYTAGLRPRSNDAGVQSTSPILSCAGVIYLLYKEKCYF